MAETVKDIKGIIEFKVAAKDGPGFPVRLCFGPIIDYPTVGITIDEEDMGFLMPLASMMMG